MYSHKGKVDFDDMNRKVKQISLAEVVKMLKDHSIYPQLIDRDEITSLIRLVNVKSNQENSRDLNMLDFNQFLMFVPQLAFLCFSRPPINKSQMPLIVSVQDLKNYFEQAAKEQGIQTNIFEDPDASIFVDKNLILALEKNCENDPDFKVPEGFTKVLEKNPIFQYQLPNSIKKQIKESQSIVIEILNEIVFKAIQVNFLEPILEFQDKIRVKQAFKRKINLQSENAGYMRNIEKKTNQNRVTAFATMSASEKRKDALEIKPKINLTLKLQVTQQDLKNRPHYQEVAEVLEEMLQATEIGLLYLPNRLNRAPGQILNDAIILKNMKNKEEKNVIKEKESLRLERNQEIKKIIKETNYGGREKPIEKWQKEQAQLKEKLRVKKEFQDMQIFQRQAQKSKAEIDEIKNKQLEEIKKKQEQEQQQIEKELIKAKLARKQFLKLQQQKMKTNFKDTISTIDEIDAKKGEKSKIQTENLQKLKLQVVNHIKETQVDRENEKKEKKDIENFMEQQEVKSIFEKYNRPLLNLFKFYCKQDSQKDLMSFDSDILLNSLNLKELIKFCYRQKITPNFITPDEIVYIYKTLISEQQNQNNMEQSNKSGMMDFHSFKKAIVRISVSAQQKLDKDLQEELKLKNQEEILKKKQDRLNQERLSRMSQKDSTVSVNLKEQDKNQSRYQSVKNIAGNSQLMQNNDKFKNIKNSEYINIRENLSTNGSKQFETISSSGNIKKNSIKIKDINQKNLDEIQKQLRMTERLKKLKVENKQIRKRIDISNINADTIQALFMYLQLKEPLPEISQNDKKSTIGSNFKNNHYRNYDQDSKYQFSIKKDTLK